MSSKIPKWQAFYEKGLKVFGDDPRSVGWSRESQEVRFQKAESLVELDGCSVLDIGSGLGHFYRYILQAGIRPSSFTALEPLSQYAQMIRQRHLTDQKLNVVNEDFENFKPNVSFDYSFAIGTFNIDIGRNYMLVQTSIQKAHQITNQKALFFFLKSLGNKNKNEFNFYFEPDVILTTCRNIGIDGRIHEDYLEHDFLLEIVK